VILVGGMINAILGELRSPAAIDRVRTNQQKEPTSVQL